jgi:hypothetical protein
VWLGLCPGSPFAIGLDARGPQADLKQEVEEEKATLETFDLALDEIMSGLTGPFSQFVATPEYSAALKQMAQLRESPTTYSVDIERTLDAYRSSIAKTPSGGFFGSKKPPTVYSFVVRQTARLCRALCDDGLCAERGSGWCCAR